MSDWTEDNFGNEGARDYLSMLITQLVGTISGVMKDKERLAPDEDGESMLMPAIEVLSLLCERYDAAPPRPATVKGWHEKYLAAFDAGFSKVKSAASAKVARRKVIENTFRWLEGLAESYHSQG
jgi:hypothetical protein